MTVPPRPQDAAPGVAASPKADESIDRTNGPRGASPEGNGGEPGAAVPPATKLAQIEAQIHDDERIQGFQTVLLDIPDAKALVEIAEAAQTLCITPFGSLHQRDFYKLREALARLGDT